MTSNAVCALMEEAHLFSSKALENYQHFKDSETSSSGDSSRGDLVDTPQSWRRSVRAGPDDDQGVSNSVRDEDSY